MATLTHIHGLVVTNCFGERTWIEPAVDPAGPTQSWQMFRLTGKGAVDPRLFLAPTVAGALEGPIVEAVDLVRDEVANMVWGIERIVQMPEGTSRRGREVAIELHAALQAAVPTAPPAPVLENAATVAYRLMTTVPENWIPFIPVHVPGNNREVQLQRAAMPRLLEGQQGVVPAKIQPRTRLMREGLEQQPRTGYFLAEEEVERAGTVVEDALAALPLDRRPRRALAR